MILCRSCNQPYRYWLCWADHTSTVVRGHAHSPVPQTTPLPLSDLAPTNLWEGIFPYLVRKRRSNVKEIKSTNSSIVFKYCSSVGGTNRAKLLSHTIYTYSWMYWFILGACGEYTGLYLPFFVASIKVAFESSLSTVFHVSFLYWGVFLEITLLFWKKLWIKNSGNYSRFRTIFHTFYNSVSGFTVNSSTACF